MNEAFYQHALKTLNEMSDDDLCESAIKAGFKFTSKQRHPRYITISLNTARPNAFRKSVLTQCRTSLDDDAWAFYMEHGIYDLVALSQVVIIVWDDAHAVILKLALSSEYQVEVSETKPEFAN